MRIITQRRVVNQKLQQIMNGYSAYVETPKIARLLEKEIQQLQLHVHQDKTDLGTWFIPDCEPIIDEQPLQPH
ncbi:hypothetical protein EJF36_15345 [Bacillus sp. HMF5848]|uniref:hypothetical protein n=1 Tax=Bacillus sp. HMF5848 TaxID=2495421 RepID=UPI000F7740C2|nr:hypothetical protein [Bacillus sp. HMF5848]RSK28144.1 hypothetical protein EJF36_15345 [Bacillus sp. HMF5848]